MSSTTVIVLVALIVSCFSEVEVITKDDLGEVLKESPELASIGWISWEGKFRGTGWITSDLQHIVTSGHVAKPWHAAKPDDKINKQIRLAKDFLFHINDQQYKIESVHIPKCWSDGPNSIKAKQIQEDVWKSNYQSISKKCDYAMMKLQQKMKAIGFGFAEFKAWAFDPDMKHLQWAGYPHLKHIEEGWYASKQYYGYKESEPALTIKADALQVVKYDNGPPDKANIAESHIAVFHEGIFKQYDGSGSSGCPFYAEVEFAKHQFVVFAIMRGGFSNGNYGAILIDDEFLDFLDKTKGANMQKYMLNLGGAEKQKIIQHNPLKLYEKYKNPHFDQHIQTLKHEEHEEEKKKFLQNLPPPPPAKKEYFDEYDVYDTDDVYYGNNGYNYQYNGHIFAYIFVSMVICVLPSSLCCFIGGVAGYFFAKQTSKRDSIISHNVV